jgi:hypothetical protein
VSLRSSDAQLPPPPLQQQLCVVQQQPQQAGCILPQLKQLPAAMGNLGLALNNPNCQQPLQQQQQQLKASEAGTPGLPAIAGVPTGDYQATAAAVAAAAAAAPVAFAARQPSSHAAASSSKKKHRSSSACRPGSGSGSCKGRLQTRFEFNLAAVQADLQRAAELRKTVSGVGRRGDASGASSSCSEDVCSSEDLSSSSESGSGESSSSSSSAGEAEPANVAAAGGGVSSTAAPVLGSSIVIAAHPTQHALGCKPSTAAAAAGDVTFHVGQLCVQVPREQPAEQQQQQQLQVEQKCGAQLEQQSSSSSSSSRHSAISGEVSSRSAGASAGLQAARRLLGLQPGMRSAVRVVQHPDAFLEDVPPAAELQQLLARYRAQVASGSVSGATGVEAKGKKTRKSKARAAAVEMGDMGIATAAAGDVKPKKRKKKGKGKKEKQQQQPVYLSQMDHLLHTVSDAGVLCELREAEAHEMRQAAARKHWAAVSAAAVAGSAVAGNGSSRRAGVGAACSRIEELLSSLSGNRAGESAAAEAGSAEQ